MLGVFDLGKKSLIMISSSVLRTGFDAFIFVDWSFCRSCFRCPSVVAWDGGRCLRIQFESKPGQVAN